MVILNHVRGVVDPLLSRSPCWHAGVRILEDSPSSLCILQDYNTRVDVRSLEYAHYCCFQS